MIDLSFLYHAGLLTIKIEESVRHVGAPFRISLSADRDDSNVSSTSVITVPKRRAEEIVHVYTVNSFRLVSCSITSQ